MFLPECPVRIDLGDGSIIEKIGPEAIGSFIADSIERFEFFEFTIVNAVVDVQRDCVEATARLYICELRQEREGHRWTTAYGLYRDSYRKVDEWWRFARRDYSSLARGALADGVLDVFPIPGRAP
jgi:hypothetical protein